ncbi:hypothetical protein JHK87_007079 [Glycine soja]|nr:hypothetical protein JHK87_007079 [Glycine soja]
MKASSGHVPRTSLEDSRSFSRSAESGVEECHRRVEVAAKEIGDEGKQYLTVIVENSPEVKEVVQTFVSPNRELKRDFSISFSAFCRGIRFLRGDGKHCSAKVWDSKSQPPLWLEVDQMKQLLS